VHNKSKQKPDKIILPGFLFYGYESGVNGNLLEHFEGILDIIRKILKNEKRIS